MTWYVELLGPGLTHLSSRLLSFSLCAPRYQPDALAVVLHVTREKNSDMEDF